MNDALFDWDQGNIGTSPPTVFFQKKRRKS
jgi:hypothetical protein